MLRVNVFSVIPEEAKEIRKRVFTEEQGFEEEFDEQDEKAEHLVLYDESIPVGCCRIFRSDKKTEYIIGRLAVIKEYRDRGLGGEILRAAEARIRKNGGKCAALHAQCRVQSFYEKQGYTAFGRVEPEEGCPHIWMKKEL